MWMDGHVLPSPCIYTGTPKAEALMVTRTCVWCGLTTCSCVRKPCDANCHLKFSTDNRLHRRKKRKTHVLNGEVLTLGSKRAGQYEDKRRRGADEGPPVHGRVDRNMARIYTVRSPATPSLQQLSVAKLLYLHFFRLRLYLHIYKYN